MSCGFLGFGWATLGGGGWVRSRLGSLAGTVIVDTSILSGLAFASGRSGHKKQLTPAKCSNITVTNIKNSTAMLRELSLLRVGFSNTARPASTPTDASRKDAAGF
ncbi:hypothetical protein [Methylomonas sp. YC3]